MPNVTPLTSNAKTPSDKWCHHNGSVCCRFLVRLALLCDCGCPWLLLWLLDPPPLHPHGPFTPALLRFFARPPLQAPSSQRHPKPPARPLVPTLWTRRHTTVEALTSKDAGRQRHSDTERQRHRDVLTQSHRDTETAPIPAGSSPLPVP